QPGMAADLVVFDPDTVAPRKEDVVHDFPANGWRMRELADGIHYTVVNGEGRRRAAPRCFQGDAIAAGRVSRSLAPELPDRAAGSIAELDVGRDQLIA